MSERKVIIFGAGRLGEKFLYQYYDKVNIICFWDNIKTGELLNYQIKKPEANKDCFIVVATASYLEIREQLIKLGYYEFEDFIPYQIFRKKMAITYGNCHITAIQAYMERNKEFSLTYGFYPFPRIYEMKNFKGYQSILQRCELFFHQSIRKNNVYGKEYSSEDMLNHLNRKCEVIAIPNLYGRPKYLFPQLTPIAEWKMGSFPINFIDRNIADWIEQGTKIEKIKEHIYGGGIYKYNEIIDMWDSFIQEISLREREWDIKILEYIILNQKKRKIFRDINHISSETAYEIANRILDYMGYNRDEFFEIPMMDDLEAFVYTDVREALELEFEEKYIRRWGKINCFQTYEMDLNEYIEQLYQFTKFYINLKNVKEKI